MGRRYLTEAQKMFLEVYLSNEGNATAAYMAAYPTCKVHTARSEGYKLLNHPLIKPTIQKVTSDFVAETAKHANLTVTKGSISTKLAELAFGIKKGVSDNVRRLALMDLARLHGMIVDMKQVRLIKSWGDLTDEELKALVGEDGEVAIGEDAGMDGVSDGEVVH